MLFIIVAVVFFTWALPIALLTAFELIAAIFKVLIVIVGFPFALLAAIAGIFGGGSGAAREEEATAGKSSAAARRSTPLAPGSGEESSVPLFLGCFLFLLSMIAVAYLL
jgi:hypothetical protein